MEAQVGSQPAAAEQILVELARTLPPERVAQLVDFARFLEGQALMEELASAESPAGIDAENAKWDALLATEEAQDMLDRLADEALEEHEAGQTRPMRFADEGRIVPG